MIVGSKAWCKYWQGFYLRRATKWIERGPIFNCDYEVHCIHIMNDLFMSYYWRDMKPWA
jgi:hypothetical protein